MRISRVDIGKEVIRAPCSVRSNQAEEEEKKQYLSAYNGHES